MSYIAKSLRAERAQMVSDARAIIDTASPTADDTARFDALMEKADALKAQIDRVERAANLEAELAEGRAITAAARGVSVAQVEDEAVRENRVLSAYLRGGISALNDADRLHAMNRFNAAQGTGTGAAGGFSIAPETAFAGQIEVALRAFGGVRNVAKVIKTSTGAILPIPTLDDTSNVGEIIAENTAQNSQDVVFGQVNLNAYTYSSKMVLVPVQLLQDSAVDVPNLLADALATRLGRIQNQHFTTGTGTGQPQGVATAASTGVTGATGQTTSVTYADLVALMHSVDPAYRANGSWMFNDTTLAAIKRMVDSQGRPLWLPGVAAGEPDTILGKRFTVNQQVAPMAAGAKSILFGDFGYYWVRDVTGLTVRRLDERYAESMSVAFFAAMRTDARLVSAGAPIKCYINAAA